MREEVNTHAGAASVRTRSKHRSRVLLKSSMLTFSGSGCGAPLLPAQQPNTCFNTEACVVGQQKKVCLQCECQGCLFALTGCSFELFPLQNGSFVSRMLYSNCYSYIMKDV